MGIVERRDRERGARRQAILDAARELFVREGYQNVSLRKIAGRIELSPAAIYRYFPGKEDIFFALAEAGFREFHRAVRAFALGRDPLDNLKRCVWQYYRFSRTHPQYFALMFLDHSVPRIRREWEQFAFMREARHETAGLVARCVETGIFPAATDADAAFHILATAMHGAAVIRLGGRFCPPPLADVLAQDVLETTIAGLRAGVATRFTATTGFHSVAGAQAIRPAAFGPRRPVRRRPPRPAGVRGA